MWPRVPAAVTATNRPLKDLKVNVAARTIFETRLFRFRPVAAVLVSYKSRFKPASDIALLDRILAP
jgi:hypothetical protein